MIYYLPMMNNIFTQKNIIFDINKNNNMNKYHNYLNLNLK